MRKKKKPATLAEPKPLAKGVLLSEIKIIADAKIGRRVPSAAAIKQARELIQIARRLILSSPPEGELDFYNNELGIEWRNGNRLLRLTSFPVEAPRLDYGTMSSGRQGEYYWDNLATGYLLAKRLDWLSEGEKEIPTTSVEPKPELPLRPRPVWTPLQCEHGRDSKLCPDCIKYVGGTKEVIMSKIRDEARKRLAAAIDRIHPNVFPMAEFASRLDEESGYSAMAEALEQVHARGIELFNKLTEALVSTATSATTRCLLLAAADNLVNNLRSHVNVGLADEIGLKPGDTINTVEVKRGG